MHFLWKNITRLFYKYLNCNICLKMKWVLRKLAKIRIKESISRARVILQQIGCLLSKQSIQIFISNTLNLPQAYLEWLLSTEPGINLGIAECSPQQTHKKYFWLEVIPPKLELPKWHLDPTWSPTKMN